jgi:hypothetical protein
MLVLSIAALDDGRLYVRASCKKPLVRLELWLDDADWVRTDHGHWDTLSAAERRSLLNIIVNSIQVLGEDEMSRRLYVRWPAGVSASTPEKEAVLSSGEGGRRQSRVPAPEAKANTGSQLQAKGTPDEGDSRSRRSSRVRLPVSTERRTSKASEESSGALVFRAPHSVDGVDLVVSFLAQENGQLLVVGASRDRQVHLQLWLDDTDWACTNLGPWDCLSNQERQELLDTILRNLRVLSEDDRRRELWVRWPGAPRESGAKLPATDDDDTWRFARASERVAESKLSDTREPPDAKGHRADAKLDETMRTELSNTASAFGSTGRRWSQASEEGLGSTVFRGLHMTPWAMLVVSVSAQEDGRLLVRAISKKPPVQLELWLEASAWASTGLGHWHRLSAEERRSLLGMVTDGLQVEGEGSQGRLSVKWLKRHVQGAEHHQVAGPRPSGGSSTPVAAPAPASAALTTQAAAPAEPRQQQRRSISILRQDLGEEAAASLLSSPAKGADFFFSGHAQTPRGQSLRREEGVDLDERLRRRSRCCSTASQTAVAVAAVQQKRGLASMKHGKQLGGIDREDYIRLVDDVSDLDSLSSKQERYRSDSFRKVDGEAGMFPAAPTLSSSRGDDASSGPAAAERYKQGLVDLVRGKSLFPYA